MPPFDRDTALKNAEKALRQGRIDAAIGEYLKIVEAQPRDWNSANALGDLYVRASQIDKAIAQYVRIAERLAAEGFVSKAAALYKKVLKVRPGDEHALLQSAELAVSQELLVDAKASFKALAEVRRARGDRTGAAEILIRMGTLDPADLPARLGAARSASEIGDTLTALREYREVALALEKQGKLPEALEAFQCALDLNPGDEEIRGRLLAGYLRLGDLTAARGVAGSIAQLKQVAQALDAAGHGDEALDVLTEVARRDPDDVDVRARLAESYVAIGELERAQEFLGPEIVARNAPLSLVLARAEFAAGRTAEGRAAVAQALALDAGQREPALALALQFVATNPAAAFAGIEAIVDHAGGRQEFVAAASALEAFISRVPQHLVALMRLIEVCVDGNLDVTLYEAQAQLADAYLEAGRGLEARIISEDLIAREPGNPAQIERFRRALVMLGETDPDRVIADRLSEDSPFLVTMDLDLNEGVSFDEPGPLDTPPAPEVEIDLDVLSDPAPATAAPVDRVPVAAADVVSPPSDAPASPAAEEEAALPAAREAVQPPAPDAGQGSSRSLGDVFRQMREEVGSRSAEEAAAEQYSLALTYKELGMMDEAMQALREAARSARQRFDAASLLGRLHLDRGERGQAVEWFERAAEAPAPTPDAAHALLYDLAETLDAMGEHSRALAVFVELEAESGGYRDVAHRIGRLSNVQTKG